MAAELVAAGLVWLAIVADLVTMKWKSPRRSPPRAPWPPTRTIETRDDVADTF